MLEITDRREWDLFFVIKDGHLYLDGVDGDIYPYFCTEELHDILVDFLNMGIKNTLYSGPEVYLGETEAERNILAELKAMSLAKSRPTDEHSIYAYIPTILYGMIAPCLIEAIAEELQEN